MATVDITDVRPNGNSFAEGRLNPPAELWTPVCTKNLDSDVVVMQSTEESM